MEKRKYALARHFRRNLTDAEARLWFRLKGKPDGLHFRRQHPVGPYITDFYCAAARLVIEIDGQVHGTEDIAERDERRTAYLEARGLTVYRLSGADVMGDPDEAALCVILTAKALVK
jgi:very-short-patch-repair endonuclease